MIRRLPRPLRRRDILYGVETPAEELVEHAGLYFEENLVFDAADFFARAKDRPGLARVKARAIEMGDAFLLHVVQQALPELVSDADWKDLGDRARSLGKDAYAARAALGGGPPPPPLAEEAEGARGEAGEEKAAPAEKADKQEHGRRRRRHGGGRA